jgi:hypothetical protein
MDIIPVAFPLGTHPGFVRKSKTTVISPAACCARRHNSVSIRSHSPSSSILMKLNKILESFGADPMEGSNLSTEAREVSGSGRVYRMV